MGSVHVGWIFGGNSETGTGFFLSTSVFPISIIPPLFHTHSFIYHWCKQGLQLTASLNSAFENVDYKRDHALGTYNLYWLQNIGNQCVHTKRMWVSVYFRMIRTSCRLSQVGFICIRILNNYSECYNYRDLGYVYMLCLLQCMLQYFVQFSSCVRVVFVHTVF